MRVLKIIQANPEIFDTDQHQNYTETEAIRKIAALDCKGNKVQKQDFEIRQAYTAINNLIDLGYLETAIELAIRLVPKAAMAQQFNIAKELCNTLISHFYQEDDLKSVDRYKSLYDKFNSNVFHEHETMMLFGKALYNHRKIIPKDLNEVKVLLEAIKKKLPYDSLWYYYYYYQFKAVILEGEDLEKLYHEAIGFFKNLHFNHSRFTHLFNERLILFYIDTQSFEKADKYLKLLDSGSIVWFRTNLYYVKVLLGQSDIKANDICASTMNHPYFIDLSLDFKKEWRAVYKDSVKLILNK